MHRLVEIESAGALLANVLRLDCSGTDDQQQPVASGNCPADFVREGRPTIRHANAVEPDVEAARGQILVQPANKRLVIAASVRQENGDGRAVHLSKPVDLLMSMRATKPGTITGRL